MWPITASHRVSRSHARIPDQGFHVAQPRAKPQARQEKAIRERHDGGARTMFHDEVRGASAQGVLWILRALCGCAGGLRIRYDELQAPLEVLVSVTFSLFTTLFLLFYCCKRSVRDGSFQVRRARGRSCALLHLNLCAGAE